MFKAKQEDLVMAACMQISGYSYPEIAETLGCSTQNVSGMIQRDAYKEIHAILVDVNIQFIADYGSALFKQLNVKYINQGESDEQIHGETEIGSGCSS